MGCISSKVHYDYYEEIKKEKEMLRDSKNQKLHRRSEMVNKIAKDRERAVKKQNSN
jgi:hypothetical protein